MRWIIKAAPSSLLDEVAKKKFKEIPKLKITGATANTIEINFGGVAGPPSPTKPVPE